MNGTTALERHAKPRRGLVTRLRRDDRGSVAPFAGIVLVVIIGMAGLVVDLGWFAVVRGELQNAADAGALAGVVELVNSGETVAQSTATTYTTQAKHYRLTQPAPQADAVSATIPGPETLRVQVRRATGTAAGPVATVFARIWGKDSVDVQAVAVATLNRRIIGAGPGNLLPFGVRDTVLDQDGDGNYDIGTPIDVYPHDESEGNFGLLDLNGGANSNSETADWVENGYGESFTIPEDPGYVDLEGDPGISGDSLTLPTGSRLNDIVLFPVFNQVTNNGANTTYRVVDFVGATIRDFKFYDDQTGRKLIIEITGYSSQNLIVGGPGTPSNNTVATPVLIQ